MDRAGLGDPEPARPHDSPGQPAGQPARRPLPCPQRRSSAQGNQGDHGYWTGEGRDGTQVAEELEIHNRPEYKILLVHQSQLQSHPHSQVCLGRHDTWAAGGWGELQAAQKIEAQNLPEYKILPVHYPRPQTKIQSKINTGGQPQRLLCRDPPVPDQYVPESLSIPDCPIPEVHSVTTRTWRRQHQETETRRRRKLECEKRRMGAPPGHLTDGEHPSRPSPELPEDATSLQQLKLVSVIAVTGAYSYDRPWPVGTEPVWWQNLLVEGFYLQRGGCCMWTVANSLEARIRARGDERYAEETAGWVDGLRRRWDEENAGITPAEEDRLDDRECEQLVVDAEMMFRRMWLAQLCPVACNNWALERYFAEFHMASSPDGDRMRDEAELEEVATARLSRSRTPQRRWRKPDRGPRPWDRRLLNRREQEAETEKTALVEKPQKAHRQPVGVENGTRGHSDDVKAAVDPETSGKGPRLP